jgi:hypothetical protein
MKTHEVYNAKQNAPYDVILSPGSFYFPWQPMDYQKNIFDNPPETTIFRARYRV